MVKQFGILGGGLAGLSLSYFLGEDSEVLEKDDLNGETGGKQGDTATPLPGTIGGPNSQPIHPSERRGSEEQELKK